MRLLIVDDHEVVRRGVRSLLSEQPGFEICGEAVDGEDALAKARSLQPDLIVMDVSMPRLNGLEATRQVRSLLPNCEVVILSQHEAPEMARQALKAGARGYVVKSSISRDLISAAFKASRKEFFFDAAILEQASSSHVDLQEVLQRSAAFEQALRESEQLYRSTFELAAVGVSHVDPTGRWLRVNKKVCEIVGYSEPELLNMSFQDITHPDDLEADLALTEKVRSGILNTYTMEKRYIRKDGSVIWVNLTVSSARESNGKLHHFIAVVEDITERRRMKSALQESQTQLALALDSSRTAIFDWDIEAMRGSWNSQMAVIYNFQPAGQYITAEEWRSLFHPDDVARLSNEAAQVYREQQQFHFEFRIIRPDGEIRWILSHGRVVRDASGKAVRLIGTHTDITERRKAEQSTSLLAAMVDCTEDAVISRNLDSIITSWNKGAERLLGYSAAEMIGQPFKRIIPPDRHDEDAFILSQLRMGKSIEHFETVRCHKNGNPVEVSLTISPIRDSAGNVVGGSTVARDIGERKQSEQILAVRNRQQKALFHLADELHRAVSLPQIYDAALNAILDALQCDRASVLLCDKADVMRFQSWRGLSRAYRAAVEGHSAWKPGETNPQPVCIANVESAGLTNALKATVKAEGIVALAFIPLVSKGKLIGKFMTYFDVPHEFTDEELALSLTIARQLAFAIERRRSDEDLQQSREQLALEAQTLAAMNERSARLWRAASLSEGLEEILSAIIELLGADKGNIQLLDPDTGVLTIAAQRGFEQEFLEFFQQVSAGDDSACGRALRSGERAVIEDVDADSGYFPFRGVARAANYRAVVSTPLMAAAGVTFGVVSVHFRSPHCPSDQDLDRMDLYVRQAADFIQRCQTEEVLRRNEERFRQLSQQLDVVVRSRTRELEEKNTDLLRQSEQVRQLSQNLLRTQDEERRRIARELHDSAGQTLSMLGLTVGQFVQDAERVAPDLARRGQEIQEFVEQLQREIRTASYLLHPPLLDESGLASALQWYIQGLGERGGLAITLEISPNFDRLPSALELAIFRLVQESLTNVHRHSGSKTAFIGMSQDTGMVRVQVRDQGKGIAPERLSNLHSGGSGVGIRGMQERLRPFHGEVKIESSPAGTCVLVTVPIPGQVPSNDTLPLEARV